MDRIKDSGSFDWGSTPHRLTIKISPFTTELPSQCAGAKNGGI